MAMDRRARERLSTTELAEMGRLVEAYFSSVHRAVTVSGYDVSFADGSHRGLANLAQVLANCDRADWESEIARHFEPSDDDDHPSTWSEAAERVRLRLFRSEAFPPGHPAVTWPVCDDLAAVLMLDGAEQARPLNSGELVDWRVKSELAFDRALHNSVKLEAVETEQKDGENGADLRVLHGGFYTSVNVLVLERHLDGEAPHGAVVAIPNRHVVLFHRIVDAGVMSAVNTMIITAGSFYDQGPGAISPFLYWWQPDRLVTMEARFDGGAVHFDPPEEFTQLVHDLPEAPRHHPERKRRGFFGRNT